LFIIYYYNFIDELPVNMNSKQSILLPILNDSVTYYILFGRINSLPNTNFLLYLLYYYVGLYCPINGLYRRFTLGWYNDVLCICVYGIHKYFIWELFIATSSWSNFIYQNTITRTRLYPRGRERPKKLFGVYNVIFTLYIL